MLWAEGHGFETSGTSPFMDKPGDPSLAKECILWAPKSRVATGLGQQDYRQDILEESHRLRPMFHNCKLLFGILECCKGCFNVQITRLLFASAVRALSE